MQQLAVKYAPPPALPVLFSFLPAAHVFPVVKIIASIQVPAFVLSWVEFGEKEREEATPQEMKRLAHESVKPPDDVAPEVRRG